MLEINRFIKIPFSEFQWTFARSGGPGGQNVNKVASKAVLRWNIECSPTIPHAVKARLRSRHSARITSGGDIVLSSQKYRHQEMNRLDCLLKLRSMVLQATISPKERKSTRPTKASHQRRLDTKRHRARIKESRRAPAGE